MALGPGETAAAPTGEVVETQSGYIDHVVGFLLPPKQQRGSMVDEISAWYSSQGQNCTAADHIAKVLEASGISSPSGRSTQVADALRRQQQLAADRKNKKKAKDMMSTTTTAEKKSTRPNSVQFEEKDKEKEGAGGVGILATAPELVEEWTKVQDFATEEEAMRFIMECQPIDYRPLFPQGSEAEQLPFPRFESTREAFEYVKNMDPLPREYRSVEGRYHEKLRISKVEAPVVQTAAAAAGAPGTAAARRLSRKNWGNGKRAAGGNKLVETMLAAQDKAKAKPWVVESTGMLFDRLDALRDIHRAMVPSRYFIAVAPELEKQVLAEGYKVSRRSSIPCSTTPAEARNAFDARSTNDRKSSLASLSDRPQSGISVVFAVTLPPGVDVIANRKGGYLLRCQEIPPQYLVRLRR